MMRVPLEWLKDYVPVRLAPEALAERLTMAGLEVTGIERINGEPVFTLEITPNRPDCLSIVGIAREVAAITGQRLRLSGGARGEGRGAREKRHPRPTSHVPRPVIRIVDRKGCRRYIGRLIEGVKIGPSPAWMQKRLMACGLRPINNVVDITNYVLLEWGQPLHAFDYDYLQDGTILVRRAQANEAIVTIDGEARKLSSQMLVIADAKRPVAIAGVMGGRDTEVTNATKRLLLESAWFDPILVRRMSRALGLASESSYRFERGIDPVGVALASQRAAFLIRQLAGGTETAWRDVGERLPPRVAVSLEPTRMARWLGASVSPTQGKQTLERLGFSVRSGRTRWQVGVPSFRRDVTQDVDLFEEVARLIGYDRLPATIPQAPLQASSDHIQDRYHLIQSLRGLCASLGLSEVMTWALVSEAELEQIGLSRQEFLRLANPLSRDQACLRPTLFVGMLKAVSKNVAQGAIGVRAFELGHIFQAGSRPSELLCLGVGITGTWERSWQGGRMADGFRLKGLIEQLVSHACAKPLVAFPESVPWAEAGQSMGLVLNGKRLGVIGQVAKQACRAFDLDEPVWFGELSVDVLLQAKRSMPKVRALSAFPPVKRDVSFIVDRHTECAKLFELIRSVGSPLAHRIELVDRYTGPQVPEKMHSLTFSIEYRDPTRTLTATEVDQLHRKISEALIQRFGAQLR